MADNPQTLSAITSALAQTFPDKIRRQINRRAVLLSILAINKGAGKNVPVDVEADGAIAENFAEGAVVANFGSDALVPSVLPWGLYRSNFRVTNLAAAAAESSSSPTDAHDLIGRGLDNSMAKLSSLINGDSYTGNGAGSLIAGLSGSMVRDDNTYAAIDRTVGANAYWKASVFDSANSAISFRTIRADGNAIYVKSGSRPDIAVCSPDVQAAIKGLFDDGRRFDMDVSTATRGVVRLENSAGVVAVEGIQFIEDKDAVPGEIVYLNSAEVSVVVLPQAKNFADPLGAADDGFNTLMLAFHAYELGRVGSDRRMSVEAQLQLRCERPNTLGRRSNIAT